MENERAVPELRIHQEFPVTSFPWCHVISVKFAPFALSRSPQMELNLVSPLCQDYSNETNCYCDRIARLQEAQLWTIFPSVFSPKECGKWKWASSFSKMNSFHFQMEANLVSTFCRLFEAAILGDKISNSPRNSCARSPWIFLWPAKSMWMVEAPLWWGLW